MVQCLFAADSLLTLSLGQSAPVLAPDDPSFGGVTTATVRIYEDGVFAGEAEYVPNRLRYVSHVRARAGRSYRLRVDAPGFDAVEAEDTVPLPTPFQIEVVRGPEPEEGYDRIDAVAVRFSDPPGDEFYALYGLVERAYPNGEGNGQLFPLAFESTDPILTDGFLTGLITDPDNSFYLRAFFRSVPFDGTEVAIRIGVRRYVDPPGTSRLIGRLRLATLSETYYRYVRARELDNGGTPFSNPQQIPSNVEGGYGIFAAFAAAEQILPE